MALYNGTSVVADTTGLRIPRFATSTRPAAPVEGQVIWNSTTRKIEMYDGGYWKEMTDSLRPFLYRTIITTGYVLGGYQNSTPWRNGNRVAHATNVVTNLGDVLPYAAGYYSGAVNLTTHYQFGTNTLGASTTIGAFNMATESNAGWIGDMRVSRDSTGCVFKETQFAYICNGGSAAVDVFNLTNGTIYKDKMGPDSTGGENVGGALSDEVSGYIWTTSYNNKLMFATGVSWYMTDTHIRGNHGYMQGCNSKLRKGWASNDGTSYQGYQFRRFNYVTDANVGLATKPVSNSGEENYDMGQDHNYMLGCHDGAQNNRSGRWDYTTETGYELGAGSVSTGVGGRSSASCGWKG